MGTTMTAIIEWTHDAQCALSPEVGLALEPPRWHDDHLHGVLFQTDKEYDFFAAVAGVRNRFERPHLIAVRGVPSNLSYPAHRHFADSGSETTGWLHLSEIDQCIRHIRATEPFHMDFDLIVMLDFMRGLVSKLTDPHVRLVFDIG
jgi:hypothetical protein